MCIMKENILCPMTPEAEEAYTLHCAKRVLRYSGILLWLIIGIQLYNLIYVAIYTHGRFHTLSSQVYSLLYLALILLSLAVFICAICFKRSLPARAKEAVRLQTLYSIAIMAWGTCITLYDQRVSDNITVYLIIALTAAMLANFRPIQSTVIYGSFLLLHMLLMPVFQGGWQGTTYGKYIDLLIMTLICIFISVDRYVGDRRSFLDRQAIISLNERLNRAVLWDSLTQIRNRRFLDENGEDLFRQCADSQIPLTVMMIDIDCFKEYNDTYGHQQGDECLRRIAWRLTQELDAEKEYLIRYGGEEFLYLGLGVDKGAAAETCEQLCKVVRELIIGPSDQDPRSVTISIGAFTQCPSASDTQEEWLRYVAEADKAAYAAKRGGRDRWVIA